MLPLGRLRGFGPLPLLLLGALALVPSRLPAAGPSAGVYTCTSAAGKHLTSDRPIPECADREQKVLNADGSVRRVLGPSMTADERAAQEAQERRAAAERTAFQEAARRDRNLMLRYPDEASHQAARARALDDVKASIASSQRRLQILTEERKPLADEAEFYVGKKLPMKLKQQIDANEGAAEAQRTLIANQQAELERINATYDVELARLRKLWAGAQPGSMGPLRDPTGVATAARAAVAASAAAPPAAPAPSAPASTPRAVRR